MRLESAGTHTHGLGLTKDEKELWVTSLLDNAIYIYGFPHALGPTIPPGCVSSFES
jgi:hypothetical protein